MGRLESRSVETRPSLFSPRRRKRAWRSYEKHLLVFQAVSAVPRRKQVHAANETRLISKVAKLLAGYLMRQRDIRRCGLQRAHPYPRKGGSLTRPMCGANFDGAHNMPSQIPTNLLPNTHERPKDASYQNSRQPIGAARRRRWSD